MLRVAIQGYQASFHDVAAQQMLGKDIGIIPCDTFVGVFKSVLSGAADYGVVATANSIYGPIHESLHLFKRYNVLIQDQTDVAVSQCLITQPNVQLSTITHVYSHPVALAQCQPWLAAHLPHALLASHADTAGAVADIASGQNPHIAAIAGPAAARLYGMQIQVADIQSAKQNVTTFALFTAPAKPAKA